MIEKDHKNIASSYKKIAIDKLLSYGINDNFTVKVKSLPNTNWVAMYKGNSQYRRLPIFWVSPKLIKDKDEFIISILHAYLLHS
jgi:hypothetical protein